VVSPETVPLAWRRLPIYLLALAIKASRWPAEDVTRDPTAHSRNEGRETWIYGELLKLCTDAGHTRTDDVVLVQSF
jgi:hypothetical protein